LSGDRVSTRDQAGLLGEVLKVYRVNRSIKDNARFSWAGRVSEDGLWRGWVAACDLEQLAFPLGSGAPIRLAAVAGHNQLAVARRHGVNR